MRKSARIVWASLLLVGCGTSSGIDAGGGGTIDARIVDAPVATNDTIIVPDAAPVVFPDCACIAADAPVVTVDAPAQPDAAPVVTPDAAPVVTPDAAPSHPDGAPAHPDAAPPPDASCSPPTTYGGGEISVAGDKTVTARIVDETGAPVVGQPIYICGLDICSDPGTTQANGAVSLHTSLSEKKPAFKVGDTIAYAELAIPLTMSMTDFTAGGNAVINIAKLAGKPGAPLTPGTSAVSGDVTIVVPAGAAVGIDTLVYDSADSQKLRAVSIPIANEGPVLASSGVTGFGLLYGVAPAETTLCPPMKVTVALSHATMSPNDLGWAPGSAVEFWVMTVDTGQTYAPYAGWAKMSDGVVSADGLSVSTVAGQGFNFLQTFAIRKVP